MIKVRVAVAPRFIVTRGFSRALYRSAIAFARQARQRGLMVRIERSRP